MRFFGRKRQKSKVNGKARQGQPKAKANLFAAL
jgi:hypothetical protein